MRFWIFRTGNFVVLAGLLASCASGPVPSPLPAPAVVEAADPTLPRATQRPPPRETDGRQRFNGVFGAIQAAGLLAGNAGPASVNWIDGGDRFSYTALESVHPGGGGSCLRLRRPWTEEVAFNASSLRMADGSTLTYDAFQWAADSRHVLFQTDFRPIYRRSGISDYYLYDLEDGDLNLVADDVRSAELSPGWRLDRIRAGWRPVRSST